MKRAIAYLLISCVFLLSGCTSLVQTSDNQNFSEEKNAILIIEGKEPSGEYYAYIDHENETAVLPLLTVAQSLGAELKWITKNIVIIQFSDTSYRLNLQKKILIDTNTHIAVDICNIAPGGHGISGLPKYVDNDLLVDRARIGHFITLRGMYISIDYENSVIEIYPKPVV